MVVVVVVVAGNRRQPYGGDDVSHNGKSVFVKQGNIFLGGCTSIDCLGGAVQKRER